MSELVVTQLFVPGKEWGAPYGDKSKMAYALRAIVCCPIHYGDTPSLCLDVFSHDDEPTVSMGNFHCFVCAASGNMIPSIATGKDCPGGIVVADTWDLLYKPVTK